MRKVLRGRKRYALLAFLNALLFSTGLLFSQTSFASGPVPGDQQVFQAGRAVCASPPAGFNPLTASKHDLLYYGLPARPTDTRAHLTQWLSIAKAARKRSCTFVAQHHARPAPLSHSAPTPSKSAAGTTPSAVRPLAGSESYFSSSIWSGYVANQNQAQAYNYVQAYWNVPCITIGRTNTGSQVATWVGLGGWNSDYLWQAGTEVETGTPAAGSPISPVYHMWFEAYPVQDWQIDYSHNLRCGDEMYAEVDILGANPYAFVTDTANNEYISETYIASGYFWPDRTTAEWIDERDSCPSSTAPHQLAGFQPINWNHAFSERAGSSNYLPVNTSNYYNVTMYDGVSQETLAYPNELNADGASFTDNFVNDGVGYCGLALKDTLSVSQTLHTGGNLNSQDYRYSLIMQSDGNLVLYDRDTGRAIWSSQTFGQGSSYAIMQSDGNLVIYRTSDGKPTWSAMTGGRGTCHLKLQSDGNLVIYNSSNAPVWSTGTHR